MSRRLYSILADSPLTFRSMLYAAALTALVCPSNLCSEARADATVDGFFRADLVQGGMFSERSESPVQPRTGGTAGSTLSRSERIHAAYERQQGRTKPTILGQPVVFKGRFTKSTRGVETHPLEHGDPRAGQGPVFP